MNRTLSDGCKVCRSTEFIHRERDFICILLHLKSAVIKQSLKEHLSLQSERASLKMLQGFFRYQISLLKNTRTTSVVIRPALPLFVHFSLKRLNYTIDTITLTYRCLTCIPCLGRAHETSDRQTLTSWFR